MDSRAWEDDPLARGRARIERIGACRRIVIPAKREWPLLLFLLCWFGGWTVAGITVISELIAGRTEDEGTAFTLFWLGGWALGWLFAASVLTWSLGGREILEVKADMLVVTRVAGPYKRFRRFARERISEIRVEPYEGLVRGVFGGRGSSWRHGMEWWGLGGGSIVLDYGARSHRFGNKLDPPEAHQVADLIRRDLRLG